MALEFFKTPIVVCFPTEKTQLYQTTKEFFKNWLFTKAAGFTYCHEMTYLAQFPWTGEKKIEIGFWEQNI